MVLAMDRGRQQPYRGWRAALSAGMRSVKLAPCGAGSQVRSPSCCWAMRRAMARPRPCPGLLESSRTKRSKIR